MGDAPFFTSEFPRELVIQEVLRIGRHCKVTAGGRIFSSSALVLIGNGFGTCGIGYGKGSSVTIATKNAFRDAQKTAVTIPLYENRTISHSVAFNYKQTRVIIRALPRGYGRRTGLLGTLLADSFGWQDVSIRFIGRKPGNVHKMCRAVLKSVEEMQDEHFYAKAVGLKSFNPHKMVSFYDK